MKRKRAVKRKPNSKWYAAGLAAGKQGVYKTSIDAWYNGKGNKPRSYDSSAAGEFMSGFLDGWEKRTAKRNPKKRAAVKKRRPVKRAIGGAGVRKPRKKNCAGKRKRNGSAGLAPGDKAAAAMFRKFHGKPASSVRTVDQLRVTPSVLADCGRLIELVVSRPGVKDKFTFAGKVRTATTADGGQLYFVGGDQEISLRGIDVDPKKDHVEVGKCTNIVYFTSKDFHNFEPSEYTHKFGEDDIAKGETARRPILCYDIKSKRLYFVGGAYRVKREGIVN